MHSPDVVSRSIEGEIIIVPLTSGVGENPDDLYTLNETGREIWKLVDGKKNLAKVIQTLEANYRSPGKEIEEDVLGMVSELVKKKLLVEHK